MFGKDADKNVSSWVDSVNDNDIFFSVGLIMENRKGIELAKKKKNPDFASIAAFEKKLSYLMSEQSRQIIEIDIPIAQEWGKMVGEKQQDLMDLLLAATANIKKFTLVTRNVSDFKDRVEKVIDPFKWRAARAPKEAGTAG
jgi:predicted nucleic acid-binding protein